MYGNGLSRQNKIREYNTKSDFPTVGKIGTFYFDRSNGKVYIWNGSVYAEIEISAGSGTGSFFTLTDPALNAITQSDIDKYIGVVITLTGAGNDQTLPTPTDTGLFHSFVVINNDTSTDSINIIGSSTVTVQPGKGIEFIWDGTAWIAKDEEGFWLDDGTDLKAQNSTRNINLQNGGLKDTNVTSAVNLGSAANSSLDSDFNDGSLIGSINENKTNFEDMNEPTGFVNRTDSNIVWTDTTPDRTLTISPAVTSFDYYILGKKYTKSGSETRQITDVEGQHYIYYDGSSLTSVANPSDSQIDSYIRTKSIAAIIYWDAVNKKGTLFDERHSIQMDGSTHSNLHFTRGTQYLSGLALGNILADQDGSLNTHAQFSIATGKILDEDIDLTTNTIGSTSNREIWYLSGANWRHSTSAGFGVLTTGTGRAAYNNSGAQTEVPNNQFVLAHVFAWNAEDGDPIVIQGQAAYNTIIAAREGAVSEISGLALGGLPSPELKAVGTIIYQTADAYTNSVKSRIRTTDLGTNYVDFRFSQENATFVSTNHSTLSGLSNDDHLQYALLAGRSGGQTLYGSDTTAETLSLRNNSVDGLGVTINADGSLSVNATDYETLVTDDDDIPNKKYVDDAVAVENLWNRSGTDLIPVNTYDNVKLTTNQGGGGGIGGRVIWGDGLLNAEARVTSIPLFQFGTTTVHPIELLQNNISRCQINSNGIIFNQTQVDHDFTILKNGGGNAFKYDAGTQDIEINAATISLIPSSNVTIGNGAAGVDYTLTFDGETNDGIITWLEDEDTFDLSCELRLSSGFLRFEASNFSAPIPEKSLQGVSDLGGGNFEFVNWIVSTDAIYRNFVWSGAKSGGNTTTYARLGETGLKVANISELISTYGVNIEGLHYENDYINKSGSDTLGLTFDSSNNGKFTENLSINNAVNTLARPLAIRADAGGSWTNYENASGVERFRIGDLADTGWAIINGSTTLFSIDRATGDTHVRKNLKIGSGAAGIDYTLTFDGEDNDGVLTWLEDEDTLDISGSLQVNGRINTPEIRALDANGLKLLPDGGGSNGLLVNDTGNTVITGSDNNGTIAALKIVAGPDVMIIDGNEIDSLSVNGLFLQNNTSNYINACSGGGNFGINVSPSGAKLHVDQDSDTGAIPVLKLDQADISEGLIDFIASARGVITGSTDSSESVRVELNGTVYRLALYADA